MCNTINHKEAIPKLQFTGVVIVNHYIVHYTQVMFSYLNIDPIIRKSYTNILFKWAGWLLPLLDYINLLEKKSSV